MVKTRKAERKDRTNERKGRKTQAGGKRKASKWAMAVKKVYHDMKRSDKKVEFKDALKRASEMKRKGELKL